MSQKRKSGLQRGLSEIVARQTAPTEEKARQSASLISKFAEPKPPPSPGIPSKSIPPQGIPSRGIPLSATPSHDKPEAGKEPGARPSPKLAEIVREERGYYPTFNDISDRLVPELKLDAYEQVVVYRMYRLSRGWQKDTCVVGHTKLANGTNLSRSTVQKTVARLIERGLIENLGDRGNDGTEYRVLPGVPVLQRGIPRDGIPSQAKGGISHGTRRSDGIPPGGHIKNNKGFSKDNNKKGINRLSPEEIRSFTATVVDLLGEGQSIEEVQGKFAPTMHAVDWATVRSTALAQAAPRKGK
ncbi:MAG: replication protein [Pyrinomonadaceae bacterium]